MENEMREINIEEIMTEIKANIQKRGYSGDIPLFKDITTETIEEVSEPFNVLDFNRDVLQTNMNCEVQYYEPIADGVIKKVIKKIMRKLMSFQLVPMVVRQNMFNVAVARSLAGLQKYVSENTGAAHKYMDKKQEEQYFDYHEKLMERLETKVLLLEQKIEKLESQLNEKSN